MVARPLVEVLDLRRGKSRMRLQRALPIIFMGFTVFALCFQGSFYLFEYRNGDTLAPTFFKLLKDACFVAVLSLILWVGLTPKRRTDAPLSGSVFLIGFCFWVTLAKLIDWSTYGTTSVLLLTLKNLVLYAAIVPALSMLDHDLQQRIVKRVTVVFVAVAFAQVIFSTVLFVFFPYRAFWTNDPYTGFNPFVGFFSNPNRFALFLNMAAAMICTVLVVSRARYALLSAAGLIILALSIFYTAALSQLIVYFGLLCYATAITAMRMRWRSLRLPIVALASILAISTVAAHFKSPWPDDAPNHKSPEEAELVWNLRNLAALALRGKTLDGEPFRFTSDSVVNRLKEVDDLLKSFGLQNVHSAGDETPENREISVKAATAEEPPNQRGWTSHRPPGKRTAPLRYFSSVFLGDPSSSRPPVKANSPTFTSDMGWWAWRCSLVFCSS